MKKLLVVLMVLAFAAPVVPVMADDTLDLSGAMRVRAWSKNNTGFSDADVADLQYWDQRLRIQGVISPADGVKAVFRVDFSEDTWGSDNWDGSRYDADSELQVDRAYLDVTKGMVNIKAGQQYMGLGNVYAYDNNQTGLQFTVNTPLVIRLGFAKIDENGSTNDSEDGNEDTDHYFIDLGYKADAFSVNAFYAMQTDGDDTSSDEPTLFGALAKFALGPANVMAELNSFGGSAGPSGSEVDYTGLQFVADASMKFSDMLTAGVNVFYSDGEDDADKEKITRFPNAFFGSQYYADLGAFHTLVAPFGSGDVFDPRNTNAGAMGAGIYGDFMVMDGLTISGQYVYLVAVEDGTDTGNKFSNGYTANVSLEYALAPNTSLALVYLMADHDFEDDVDPEPEALQVMAAKLQVNF